MTAAPSRFRLSFCIPCYRASGHIGRMLESIGSQGSDSPKNKISELIEVVAVIDRRDVLSGEYAKTEKAIRDWSSRAGIFCEIAEDQSASVGSARNVGAALSDSDYIWFVDSDDWLNSDRAVDKMLGVAYAYKAPIVECWFDGPFPYPRSIGMAWRRIMLKEIALAHPFPADNDQEDRAMYQTLLDDPTYTKALLVDAKLYHYNFGRSGSVTNGRIDPVNKEYDFTLFNRHCAEAKIQ